MSSDSSSSSSASAVSASSTSGDVNRGNRGIPKATFIEDVVSAVKDSKSADALLQQLQALYGKYKFMESHLVQQQKSLLQKIPDIKNALAALHHLMSGPKEKAVKVHFELADSIYANANIEKEEKVLLWLGANVMLEYNYEEADELLTKNLKNAEVNLSSLEEDLAFLKDQITVSEVNIARIHNYNVQLKKETREREARESGSSSSSSSSISKRGLIREAGTIPAGAM